VFQNAVGGQAQAEAVPGPRIHIIGRGDSPGDDTGGFAILPRHHGRLAAGGQQLALPPPPGARSWRHLRFPPAA